ncbi:MAG: hypothetical protein PHO06_02200 [Clostridia bacterium]|nr:hypothetical protein [Clostridia bacterium]
MAGLGEDAISAFGPYLGIFLFCIAVAGGAGALTLPLTFPYILSVIAVGGFVMTFFPKDAFVLGKIATSQSFTFTKSLSKSALKGFEKIKARMNKNGQFSEEEQEYGIPQGYTPKDTDTLSRILQSSGLNVDDAKRILEDIKENPDIDINKVIENYKLEKYIKNQSQGIEVPERLSLNPPKSSSRTDIKIDNGVFYTDLDDPNGCPTGNKGHEM